MVVSLSQQCKKCAGPAPGTGRRHSEPGQPRMETPQTNLLTVFPSIVILLFASLLVHGTTPANRENSIYWENRGTGAV